MLSNLRGKTEKVLSTYLNGFFNHSKNRPSEAPIPDWWHPDRLRTWQLSSRGPHQYFFFATIACYEQFYTRVGNVLFISSVPPFPVVEPAADSVRGLGAPTNGEMGYCDSAWYNWIKWSISSYSVFGRWTNPEPSTKWLNAMKWIIQTLQQCICGQSPRRIFLV